jgi:hypothetical protein
MENPSPKNPSILLNPKAAASWQKGFREGWNDFANGPKAATAIPIREPIAISPQRLKEAQQLNSFSDEESDLRKEFAAFIATLPADDKERARLLKRWLDIKLRDIGDRRDALLKKREEAEQRHALLNRVVSAWEDLDEWAGDLVLQKADHSTFRDLRKACVDGKALHVDLRQKGQEFEFTYDYEQEHLRHAEVFVIQHDWATAFTHADDIKAAPFKLPYEICAFEFQYSGRPVIALATEVDERITFTPATLTKEGWFIPGFVYFQDGELWVPNHDKQELIESYDRIIPMLGDQIRAICIALDAEVATTTLTREAHEGPRGKNAHTPPKAYHVVSLARRARAPALEPSAPTGRKKRMHFRRGHWRHFPAFKTWIRWCLVGDPDLGFVDKEYRL